jgi:carbonic anhydrase/acetyltransferase-like protein (isoleucine patch superfamily)
MLIEFDGKKPQIGEGVFIAPTAVLIGDVQIGDNTSIWFNAVLRADFGGRIIIGAGCSVQDNVTIHVYDDVSTVLAENVTVGHGAVLEGCSIGASSVIGMNAVVLPRAKVGEQVMVAAGSVITEGMEVPSRVLVAGVPAKVKKELNGRALDWIGKAAQDYQAIQIRYRQQGIGQVLNQEDLFK